MNLDPVVQNLTPNFKTRLLYRQLDNKLILEYLLTVTACHSDKGKRHSSQCNAKGTALDTTQTQIQILNFCKHILGVNRSTTNILVRGELGRYPLKLNVENRIKSFFDHVKKAPEDSLIYQAYLMNLELPSDLNCNTHIENVKRNLDLVDFHSCTKHIFKLSYKNYYNKYWTREMSSSKKGEFLFLLRKGISLEPYLMQRNK